MGFTKENVPEQDRRDVRRAVLDDLNDEDIDAYFQSIKSQRAKEAEAREQKFFENDKNSLRNAR